MKNGTSVDSGLTDDLSPLISPKSIAIIGASTDPSSISGRPLRLLRQHYYTGAIYPVNRKQETSGGERAYRDVRDISEDVDLAVVSVPGSGVPAVLDACGEKGVRAACILSAGFGEAEAGRALDGKLRAAVTRWPMRVLGPNGEGFFNLHSGVAVSFSPGVDLEGALCARPRPGNIAVVSQSGGLGFGIFDYGVARGLEFSYVFSTGNELDLEAVDLIEFLLTDQNTKVIALFIEAFRRPERLERVLSRAIEVGKPIVVAKVGRSAEGRQAALSHTAHLAENDELYRALFRRYGVVEVSDVPEMLDVATALSRWDPPAGARVGVVTGSGGAGVWVADACVAEGLELPNLEPERQQAILAELPYYAAAGNPVDVTAGGGGDMGTIRALAAVGASARVDSLAFIGVGAALAGRKAELAAAVTAVGKPVVAYAQHHPPLSTLDLLADVGLPVYVSPAGVAKGLSALVHYGRAQARHRQARPRVPDHATQTRLRALAPSAPAGVACEYQVKQLLSRAGFNVPRGTLVHSARQAADAARTLGYPVALKVQCRRLVHKSDVGAVMLSVGSQRAARSAYHHVYGNARRVVGSREIEGVLVEEMAPAGIEMMAGVLNSPQLGTFVVTGWGGVDAEMWRDFCVLHAPVAETEVRDALRGLRCWPALAGSRGRPQRDVAALCSIVANLAQFGIALSGVVRELDLNPVIVHEDGRGAVVADGFAVLADAPREVATRAAALLDMTPAPPR